MACGFRSTNRWKWYGLGGLGAPMGAVLASERDLQKYQKTRDQKIRNRKFKQSSRSDFFLREREIASVCA